jgi:hypothetical protein
MKLKIKGEIEMHNKTERRNKNKKVKQELKNNAKENVDQESHDQEDFDLKFKHKVVNNVDNEEYLNNLKNFLFTDSRNKERKIRKILLSGNFNASKDKVPWYIILPKQRSKVIWDIFVSLVGVLSVMVVIVDISWNFECFVEDINKIYFIYSIFTIIFVVDMIFKSLTAYLNERNI